MTPLLTLIAYVGPGAGLSAIGAFLALLGGIIIAIFGFVWYPIKRFRAKRKKAKEAKESTSTEETNDPS